MPRIYRPVSFLLSAAVYFRSADKLRWRSPIPPSVAPSPTPSAQGGGGGTTTYPLVIVSVWAHHRERSPPLLQDKA